MDMPNSLKTNIIETAKTGNSETIGLLYEQHHASVFRYLYYRVGDWQTAEDLTSEVFLRMVRSLAGYADHGIVFQAWLLRIARNLAIDHFRQAGASRQVELVENLPAADVEPAAAVERDLTSDALRRALSKLEADQRDVVVMRFVVNMPIADVAQTINRSEDAVKGLQRRGLMALRALLADVEVSHV